MSIPENPIARLFDTFVCFLDDNPIMFYGPYNPLEAMEFLAHWNNFHESHGIPGTWVSRPITKDAAPFA